MNDFLALLESFEFDDHDDPMPVEEGVKGGIALWKSLNEEAGFDLRGVSRRRELIPFVLVPRHFAARHDPMSLYLIRTCGKHTRHSSSAHLSLRWF